MKRMPLLIKGLVLFVLALLLLVPLNMVDGLVNERMFRQQQVEAEIANSTAQPQTLIGPIITLNYTEHWTEKVVEQKTNGDRQWNETRQIERRADRTRQLFPGQLNVDGKLLVEPRHRGIFEARVYHFDGNLRGNWQLPGLSELITRQGGKVKLKSANVSLLVVDRKGFLSQPVLSLGKNKYAFRPGTGLTGWDAGIHTDIAAEMGEKPRQLDFDIPLLLQGTSRLGVVPLADANKLTVAGSWPHPSFDGQFLPVERAVLADGFSARWSVTSMASSAQNQLQGDLAERHLSIHQLQSMGVSLVDPVSVYSNTDRALKYGFLFVGLTFASFFLYELLMRLRIHPVQYGLVGVAQALFFLLLLSLSEHLGFALAYLLAALGCVGVIGFYLSSVLGSLSRGRLFAAALGGLYAVLYLLLQSEDYALLGGSLVLFGLLTGAMVITRKMDWYGMEEQMVEK